MGFYFIFPGIRGLVGVGVGVQRGEGDVLQIPAVRSSATALLL